MAQSPDLTNTLSDAEKRDFIHRKATEAPRPLLARGRLAVV